jgi:uncharacterized membrane protein YhhN
MVVVDGVYICCCAEGKESRRGSTYFLLAYLYYYKIYYRSRKVEVVYFYFSICMYIHWRREGGKVLVVVDGVHVCCHAEGKESRRGSTCFLLAHLYYFKTWFRSRKVEVVYFYISICMYIH